MVKGRATSTMPQQRVENEGRGKKVWDKKTKEKTVEKDNAIRVIAK